MRREYVESSIVSMLMYYDSLHFDATMSTIKELNEPDSVMCGFISISLWAFHLRLSSKVVPYVNLRSNNADTETWNHLTSTIKTSVPYLAYLLFKWSLVWSDGTRCVKSY